MSFPERLKAAREYRQMTQAQLAEAIGFTPGTVAGWEAGKFRPRGAHLLEASIVLGVTPAMLTGETPFPWEIPDKPKPKPNPEPKGDPDAPPPSKVVRQHIVVRHTLFGKREKSFPADAYQEARKYCANEMKTTFEVLELITRWTRVI